MAKLYTAKENVLNAMRAAQEVKESLLDGDRRMRQKARRLSSAMFALESRWITYRSASTGPYINKKQMIKECDDLISEAERLAGKTWMQWRRVSIKTWHIRMHDQYGRPKYESSVGYVGVPLRVPMEKEAVREYLLSLPYYDEENLVEVRM